MVEDQWLIGRAEGMWGGVLHPPWCSREKTEGFFIGSAPLSHFQEDQPVHQKAQCRMWNLTTRHNGKLHGHQQWLSNWHHNSGPEKSVSIADDSLWTRQKAGHLNRSQKEPVWSSSYRQYHLWKKEEEKKVFFLSSYIYIKKSLLFVLPSVKMRLIKTR